MSAHRWTHTDTHEVKTLYPPVSVHLADITSCVA